MSGNLLYGSDIYRFESSCIMMIGLLIIILYFTLLKKKYIISNIKQTQVYKLNGLICRFKCIENWRSYEFLHTFFWLLKDLKKLEI